MIPAVGAEGKRRLERYKRGNKLGNGVTGSVYLGVDEKTSQYVAIKVIKYSTIDNEVKTYLLMSQTNALAGLHHPNIARCLDIIQTQEECLFVMEYCPDGTLNDYIKKKGKLQESEALQILKGIVAGYRACKQAGVIHRDLKPSNVLMSNGVPKITDFGFCEINGSVKPRMYYNVGSPSYMAPEAYMDSHYSEKSDVWAIGMMFYEMLVGKTLDSGHQIEDLYKYIHRGQQFMPGGISDTSKAVLQRCFSYSSYNRIGIAELDQLLNVGYKPQTANHMSYLHQQSPFPSQGQLNYQQLNQLNAPTQYNRGSLHNSFTTIPSTYNSNQQPVRSTSNIPLNNIPPQHYFQKVPTIQNPEFKSYGINPIPKTQRPSVYDYGTRIQPTTAYRFR